MKPHEIYEPAESDPRRGSCGCDRGFALVAVLFVMVMFFLLAGALLFQSSTERVVAVNEQDHLKALGFAEAGLAWAGRRIKDSGQLSNLLDGPHGGSTADDHLVGLRDLSLNSTAQFTNANEPTASAIVQRDFTGQGARSYEVIRIADDALTRALIYVRIDDNHDDDPDDPTKNLALADRDQLVRVTAVAEYPIFVDDTGAERANSDERGRATRILRADFSGTDIDLAAVKTNGDIEIGDSMTICGACGTAHSNRNMKADTGGAICEDATASGLYSGNCDSVSGDCGGGRSSMFIPVINPYDNIFVPTTATFDTSAQTTLPPGLRCPEASPMDPGANKYFALVADAGDGRVFKAYWDFTNGRWQWAEIANLAGGIDVILDDCGRVKGSDVNFGLNDAEEVDDEASDEFYGWVGDSMAWNNCSNCGTAGADQSLCLVGNNDFTVNGYYPYPSGLVSTDYVLPGSYSPDANLDLDPTKSPRGSKWDYASDKVYSPLYGSVIWVYGNMEISGNPGASASIDFECSATAGCNPATLPRGLWQASFISLGDIEVSGDANVGPANPEIDYSFLFVAGRDLKIMGSPQEDTAACGSACSTSGFSDIKYLAGIHAVHEQMQASGNANIFGFMVGESAVDCSDTVNGDNGKGKSAFNGDPHVYYDCLHPRDPWIRANNMDMVTWQEID